ncbi:DUF1269 domain-containing protein [Aeromicrobium massiliense]|uniref:DUF1269 domain-containing protein n=1 Tax=Aeromicrobium massiliense TaxID=1464554 RepID=UPI0006769AFE|nr:DUF1269 domain-containing protein [Aeromicrobium massiliense]
MGTSSLTVWHYDSAMGASGGEVRLKDLQERGALTVLDAITVTWARGADRPRIGHLRHRTTVAASRGSVLGALAGAVLLAPLAGAAAGAGVATVVQRLRSTGIDDGVLEGIRGRLAPGTSALLVLSADADVDAVRPFVERGLARGDVTLMHVQLADDAPETLAALVRDLPPTPPA